jgi:hypothetical protein
MTVLEKFMKDLNKAGQIVIRERLWALNRCPRDKKFIRCTFNPSTGWDITLRDAKKFIGILEYQIVDISYSKSDIEDPNEYIWIGFQ